MKKYLFCIYFVISNLLVNAQVSNKINYQAIIRDENSVLIKNQIINCRISLFQGEDRGKLIYTETQFKSTNKLGVLDLLFGEGKQIYPNPSTKTFDQIDWSYGPYAIKTEIDTKNSGMYVEVAFDAINSLPFALQAINPQVGPQGNKGQNGEKGVPGKDGVKGERGDIGDTGEKGDIGETGDPGDDAIDGKNATVPFQQLSVSGDGDTLRLNDGGFLIIPGLSSKNGGTKTSIDCASIKSIGTFKKGDPVSNASLIVSYTNSDGMNYAGKEIKSSGVLGLTASLASGIYAVENGSLTYKITGTPISYGKANFVIGIGGKVCAFSILLYDMPSLTTNMVTNIGGTHAVSGGSLSSDGGSPITQKGVCWNTSSNPTIADSKTSDDIGSGSFTSQLSGLQDGTTYYVRAYATNAKGTSYGNLLSFKTIAYTTPIITTNTISNIDKIAAVAGGIIISDGGSPIIVKGICWSTNTNPTITDSKTSDGTGSGNFISKLTGLKIGTKYYVRAYATNSKGTSYGNEISFTTIFEIPVLSTNVVTNIGRDIATSGGTITTVGDFPILAKGVCWSLSANPTITDNKTNDGLGTTDFTSQLTNLLSNTRYYIRSYVTTSKGTYYGEEINFKTFINLGQMISDVDGNMYEIVNIGTQQWMAENLKVTKYNDGTVIQNITDNTQWSNLTSGAWAYYNNDAANNAKYGKLYNWFAVSPTTNGTKNVCPTGWHVPTDAEWTILSDYLGGGSIAGGKMKEVGTTNWFSPNTDATNSSLFSALPGGLRGHSGNYVYIGSLGYWWSSSEYNTVNAWNRGLNYSNGYALRSANFNMKDGLSVRCLRD